MIGEFDDIPTFSEYLASEERDKAAKRNHVFVSLAMFFYASIRITACVCATVIILNGYPWHGAGLFALSLFMRFQFTPAVQVPAPRPSGDAAGE